jgi:hypothetical protein
MKTEMDVMNLDERQRCAWLAANRFTLIVLGLIWLGMIAWELAHGSMPVFLIAMIPVIALLRLVVYRIYSRTD